MKNYIIPIVWKSYRRYEVAAENLQEAIKEALKMFLEEPDEYYLEDNFSIDDLIYEENPNEEFDISQIYNEL